MVNGPAIGALIKRLRVEKKIGQRELARRAGVSNTALYYLEKGATESPGAEFLGLIARVLGVPVSYLMGETAGDGIAFGLDVERAQHVIGLMEGVRMSDPEQFLERLTQLPEDDQELVKDIVDMMVIRKRYPRKKGAKSRTLGYDDHPLGPGGPPKKEK